MEEIFQIDPDEIVVGDRRRELNRDAVEALKASIKALGGIKVPISLRFLSNEEGWLLVAGRHRLAAAVELGMTRVPARAETGSEIDARLWEIAENLHRTELTVTERASHIAEWIRLTEERERVKAQVAPLDRPHDRGRPNQGINTASRELGIERTEAQRAVKIDALPEEVKQEAKILRLDDNQTALIKAARQPTKEEQIRALREHAVKRVTYADANASEKRIERAQTAAKALSPEEFAIFCEWFDEYRVERGDTVFDRTKAARG